jgi:integrative and conjugative element protein (TIGR02256 family)
MTIVHGIYLGAVVADTIEQESRERYPLETGGILIGRIEGDRVIVAHAIGPGPNAIHEPAKFLRDGDYAQQQLDEYVNVSEGIYDYIGEWHSHPLPVGPSMRDRESMSWISTRSAYNQEEPILILCQRIQLHQWALRGYRWHRARLRFVPVIKGA